MFCRRSCQWRLAETGTFFKFFSSVCRRVWEIERKRCRTQTQFSWIRKEAALCVVSFIRVLNMRCIYYSDFYGFSPSTLSPVDSFRALLPSFQLTEAAPPHLRCVTAIRLLRYFRHPQVVVPPRDTSACSWQPQTAANWAAAAAALRAHRPLDY